MLALGDDEVKTYFGFREVGTGKNANGDSYVTLNGKPVYLQLCLDQSYHSEARGSEIGETVAPGAAVRIPVGGLCLAFGGFMLIVRGSCKTSDLTM